MNTHIVAWHAYQSGTLRCVLADMRERDAPIKLRAMVRNDQIFHELWWWSLKHWSNAL